MSWDRLDLAEAPYYNPLSDARLHQNLGREVWLRESDDGEQRFGWREEPSLEVSRRWRRALVHAQTYVRPRDFVAPRGDGLVRRLMNRETSGRMSRPNPRLRIYDAVPRIQRAYRAFRERWPNHGQWDYYDRYLMQMRHLARNYRRFRELEEEHGLPEYWYWEPPGGRQFRGIER